MTSVTKAGKTEQTSYESTRKNIDEFNIEEARGYVIKKFIVLEHQIDALLIKYFKPVEETHFKLYMLNSSVMSFGSKIKIIKGLSIVKSELCSKLQSAASIRNSFAHSLDTPTVSISLDTSKKQKLPSKIIEKKTGFSVMNSGGKIVHKNARTLFNEFVKNFKEIDEKLRLPYY